MSHALHPLPAVHSLLLTDKTKHTIRLFMSEKVTKLVIKMDKQCKKIIQNPDMYMKKKKTALIISNTCSYTKHCFHGNKHTNTQVNC